MSSVREMGRIIELVAKLTGQLDESTRVNVLIAERDQREAKQAVDLQRLTLEERLELQRLLAKAQARTRRRRRRLFQFCQRHQCFSRLVTLVDVGKLAVKLEDIDLNLMARLNAEGTSSFHRHFSPSRRVRPFRHRGQGCSRDADSITPKLPSDRARLTQPTQRCGRAHGAKRG